MSDYATIRDLRLRLEDERRSVVETAAASAALPPRNLLAYLSDLDGAIVAVEAVLEERKGAQVSLVERPRLHALAS